MCTTMHVRAHAAARRPMRQYARRSMEHVAHFSATPAGAAQMRQQSRRDRNHTASLVGAFAARNLEIDLFGVERPGQVAERQRWSPTSRVGWRSAYRLEPAVVGMQAGEHLENVAL